MNKPSKLSRLSDRNIEDDVIRASFYARILAYLRDPKAELKRYTIRTDEEFRPDLVSWRVFGTIELKWLVMLVVGLDDEAESLPVGTELHFPTAQKIRQEMRRFLDEMGLN